MQHVFSVSDIFLGIALLFLVVVALALLFAMLKLVSNIYKD